MTPEQSSEQGGNRGAALDRTPHAARYNLRDYGGYRTTDGSLLKTGVLFRSGQLDHAAAEDQGLVARMGIDRVIDFRGRDEVAASIPAAFAGFAGSVFFATNLDNPVPHAMDRLAAAESPARVGELMSDVYRRLVRSGRFIETMRGYFHALVASEGATLVHCFAGKDRTGLAVALFQHVMGVDRADIVGEYLLTNAMGEGRIAIGAEALQRQAPDGTPNWLFREVMSVNEAFLDAGFAEIESRWGSVEAYIVEATGMNQAALADLRARYCA
jgi:protein-tyrosine phosphatase